MAKGFKDISKGVILLLDNNDMPAMVSCGKYSVHVCNTNITLFEDCDYVADIKGIDSEEQDTITTKQVANSSEINFSLLPIHKKAIFILLTSISEHYIRHKTNYHKGSLLKSYKEQLGQNAISSKKARKKLLTGANEKRFFGKIHFSKQILTFAKIEAITTIEANTPLEDKALYMYKKIKKITIL